MYHVQPNTGKVIRHDANTWPHTCMTQFAAKLQYRFTDGTPRAVMHHTLNETLLRLASLSTNKPFPTKDDVGRRDSFTFGRSRRGWGIIK